MTRTITFPMSDGVQVVVPNSLELITPYVLCEQQDWFEDELKFLRKLLQPGWQIIDIGANYGVYSLSMAKLVGEKGRVWAFEPASMTATYLEASIALNALSQISLEKCALSSSSGVARLSLSEHAELNALSHDDTSSGESEEVPVVTLDSCIEKHAWTTIDFLKIDAEGEEANILLGGTSFFKTFSPLVQFEVIVDKGLDFELVEKFSALGFDVYRLIPALNVLVPFDPTSMGPGYVLNLFGCKKDRARILAQEGFLALPEDIALGLMQLEQAADSRDARSACASLIEKYAYARILADTWSGQKNPDFARLDASLALHAFSRDHSNVVAKRYVALKKCLAQLISLCEEGATQSRLASLARVAREIGERSLAVKALSHLCQSIFDEGRVDPSEPFLPAVQRFEQISPETSFGNWFLSSVLEGLELTEHFSSFFAGKAALRRLEQLHELGFASAEMQRRLRLVKARFG